MKRLRIFRTPSPSMLIGVIAIVLARTGTAVAGTKLGLGALSNGAKNKTVGVGRLTYVTTRSANINTAIQNPVSATCPSGLKVIGGGIKLNDPATQSVSDTYPTATGWAGRVGGGTTGPATVTAICASSRVVTGSPPSS